MGVAQAQTSTDIQVNVANHQNQNLQFTNEQMVRADEWLSYVGDAQPNNMVGIGRPFYWGYMFPAQMLTDYFGYSISKVAYFDPGYEQFAGTYELHIWWGGDLEPSLEVINQKFEVTGESSGIKEIELEQTVDIDGTQNIWVAFYQNGEVQYPAVAMDDQGEPNSRWIGLDDYGWTDMATVQGGEGRAWVLWAYAEESEAIGEFDSNVAVYPNPTQGNVTVTAPGMNQVSVFNAIGQLVYEASVGTESVTLELGQYQAGVYMVRVAGENGVSVKRVTVM